MKKIVFIVPYFGHFNNCFEIWLNSCANNPTIDWLIFTDCKDMYNYPPNVKVRYMTFEAIKSHFQSFYDFKISLDKPYKLCDFRPAYGEIFYEYIKNYDFWGYCDTDLVWGDLRRFITDEILNKYDKIGNRGHCCIMRNTDRMRQAYRYEDSNFVTYKDAFSSELAYCFDEEKAFGKYCAEMKDIKTYDNYTFFDIEFHYDDYRIAEYEKDIFNINTYNIFEYIGGRLFVLSAEQKANNLIKKEISYAHFQKRTMNVEIEKGEYNHFYAVKDRFVSPDIVVSKIVTVFDSKRKIPIRRLRILWHDIKVKVFHANGVRYYKY